MRVRTTSAFMVLVLCTSFGKAVSLIRSDACVAPKHDDSSTAEKQGYLNADDTTADPQAAQTEDKAQQVGTP